MKARTQTLSFLQTLLFFFILFSQCEGFFRNRASILPPFRCSKNYQPQISVLLDEQGAYTIKVSAVSQEFNLDILKKSFSVSEDYLVQKFRLSLQSILEGDFEFHVVVSWNETTVIDQKIPYQVINTQVTSTRLLDGAWIDIYHYDNDEGRPYNYELAKMTPKDWDDEIRFMSGRYYLLNGIYLHHNFLFRNRNQSWNFTSAFHQ